MDNKEKISMFLKDQVLGVLSTVNDKNHSESAVVAFAESGLNLIFGTFNTFRKYNNLMKNNFVSIVFGVKPNSISLQYEGIALELSGKELEYYREIHLKKNPSSRKKYAFAPQQRYFLIKPTWIRYLDYSIGEEFKVNF